MNKSKRRQQCKQSANLAQFVDTKSNHINNLMGVFKTRAEFGQQIVAKGETLIDLIVKHGIAEEKADRLYQIVCAYHQVKDGDFVSIKAAERRTQFGILEQQLVLLLTLLNEFKNKLQRQNIIIEKIRTEHKNHFDLICGKVEQLKEAKCWTDLEAYVPPKLNWLQDIPVCKTEELKEAWENMRLIFHLDQCKEQLKLLSSVNVDL